MANDHFHHDHEPEEHAHDAGPEPSDVGQRSLADALRLSFRLLSVIMVIVLVALLSTGLTQVHPGEVGVRMLLGRISGQGANRVLGPGLRWSLPEPIGRIVKVPTGDQKLDINDFWFHESPADALKPLKDRALGVANEGLRPGYDGALLTGDRGLIHVKFTVLYAVRAREGKPDPEAVIQYVTSLREPVEAVRSAVCNAAIQAAATRTMEAIYTTDSEGFAKAVAVLAQRRLNDLHSGLEIQGVDQVGGGSQNQGVKIPVCTVPLAAITAFDAVTGARQDMEQAKIQALRDAETSLHSAAGSSWDKLVGNVRGEGGLLGDYETARKAGDFAVAERILEEMNTLLSSQSEGEAARIINDARSYSATVRQEVQTRANRFQELRAAFEAAPELMLQGLWADAKKSILTAETNEKYYLSPGQKTVLKVNQDPEVRRRILEQFLKAKESKGERK